MRGITETGTGQRAVTLIVAGAKGVHERLGGVRPLKRGCDEREAYHLARKLVLGQSKYLSKSGELNSDGRKLLEELARSALRCRPELKGLITRVRRRPVLENVIKLVEAFVDRGEVEGILEVLREGPYTYLRTPPGRRAERVR